MTAGEQFAALVADVARQVSRRRSSDACCGDLTLEQFETLQAVSRTDEATIGLLSSQFGVDASTMSRNVSVLERNGYLGRARSDSDGRIVRVGLTAKGRRAVETLRCGERDVLATVYAGIPAAERAAVINALQVLRASLSADSLAVACCPAPVAIRKGS